MKIWQRLQEPSTFNGLALLAATIGGVLHQTGNLTPMGTGVAAGVSALGALLGIMFPDPGSADHPVTQAAQQARQDTAAAIIAPIAAAQFAAAGQAAAAPVAQAAPAASSVVSFQGVPGQ